MRSENYNMIKIIPVLVALLVAVCNASPVADSRTENSNSISYFVYTRSNSREPVQLLPTLASIIYAPITFSLNTAIVVHGHQESAWSSLNPIVKDAFLSSEDITVIVVDWSGPAALSYSNAVNAVPDLGLQLAYFIKLLVTYNRISLDRLHLVGFNLGAHLVGFTGRNLGGGVARITGLDPTARNWGSNTERLSSSDARYVEVIHTDGDGLTANGIGTAIGDVDFFPNGGGNQPGCLFHACSHNRAWELFAATLIHNHLIGNHCSSNLQLTLNRCRGYSLNMGNNDLVKFGSGVYRVNTGRIFPY